MNPSNKSRRKKKSIEVVNGYASMVGWVDKNWNWDLEQTYIFNFPILWRHLNHCPMPTLKTKVRITIEEI